MLWHEDDEFWTVLGPLLLDPARIEAGVDEAAQALRLLGLGAGARILDLGCGPGRHSIALGRAGCRVTGVDRTAAYLEQARARAGAEGAEVEFVLEDMRRFRREAAFDGAINLFTSFGYFESAADDLGVLANVYASLRPGGRLVMQMAGKEVLARIFDPKDWMEYPDGSFLLFEREAAESWSKLQNRWIWIRGAERKEFNFAHRLYSAAELGGALRGAGFATVECYGSLEGTPYDRQAGLLVAVATK